MKKKENKTGATEWLYRLLLRRLFESETAYGILQHQAKHDPQRAR